MRTAFKLRLESTTPSTTAGRLPKLLLWFCDSGFSHRSPKTLCTMVAENAPLKKMKATQAKNKTTATTTIRTTKAEMTLQYKRMQAWISCRSTLTIKFPGSFSSREVSLHRKSATFREDDISSHQPSSAECKYQTPFDKPVKWHFRYTNTYKSLHFRTIYKSLHCANCFPRLSLPVKAQTYFVPHSFILFFNS